MTFEERVVQFSKDPMAKLYPAAKRAADKPDTDVKIGKKAAYYVIRDCAAVTRQWLPAHLLSRTPMEEVRGQLKGNVKREEIIDFVRRSKTGDAAASALLDIILQRTGLTDDRGDDAYTYEEVPQEDNIYGEYGSGGEVKIKAPAEAADALSESLWRYFS